MTYGEVYDKLMRIHHDVIGRDEDLQLNVTFETQDYDSLDKVEFLMSVEKELNITLPDENVDEIRTPHQLVEFIVMRHHFIGGPNTTV